MQQISVRVEDSVKTEAERTFKDIGISMSSAINIYLKRVARDNAIPFELSADPFYSYENMIEVDGRILDYENGKDCFHSHELIEQA